MAQRPYVAVLVAAVVLSACSVKRSGLGGSAQDAGNGSGDAGMDARPPGDAATSPKDSGPEPDARADDAGARCAGDEPVCEGTVLRTCEEGVPHSKDCAASDAYCDVAEGADAPSCIARVCTPGARRCSGTGDAVVECDARGAKEVSMPCAAGCDPATADCRPIPDCALSGVTDIPSTSASLTFDLCGQGDDARNQTSPGCGTSLGGQDRIFRLVLETATDIWIDLRDEDGSRPIDTVLYLRTRCDDPSSQLACHDDISCSDSDFSCSSGTERRQSRIETRLEPGVYYVVADSYDYRDRGTWWGCGTVLLRYRTR